MSSEGAYYTGQAELAGVIQDGMEARRAGDVERATAKLGPAVKLATESGNADTATLLAKVVDVVDPVTGTIRLRARSARPTRRRWTPAPPRPLACVRAEDKWLS